MRKSWVKKGLIVGIILLLTTTSFMSIQASVIDKRMSQKNAQITTEYNYLGKMEVKWGSPVTPPQKLRPDVNLFPPEPENRSYSFPVVDGKYKMNFSVDCAYVKMSDWIFPFRWNLFEVVIWIYNTSPPVYLYNKPTLGLPWYRCTSFEWEHKPIDISEADWDRELDVNESNILGVSFWVYGLPIGFWAWGSPTSFGILEKLGLKKQNVGFTIIVNPQ